MKAEIYEKWDGNIELTYPAETPYNPYPHQPFKVTLVESDYGYYYYMHSRFLGHEPEHVKKRWKQMFDTAYSNDNRGSKEKMIARMDEFIEWLYNNK